MTPKERKAHLEQACRSIGADQGTRCTDHSGRIPDAGAEGIPDPGYVMAAAITISVLVGLRELSYGKPLGSNDIQACIDGFFDAAEIEETRSAMGAIIYQRKAKETT